MLTYFLTWKYGVISARNTIVSGYKKNDYDYPYLRKFYGKAYFPLIVKCDYEFDRGNQFSTIGYSLHIWYFFGNVQILDYRELKK